MKKFKKLIAVLLMAAGLTGLIFSGFKTATATPTIGSGEYVASINLSSIGVSLNENGNRLTWRDYVGSKWEESEKTVELLTAIKDDIRVGNTYPEVLTVTNSGNIDEYVRVTIYKYWMKDGKKDQEKDPSLIILDIPENNNWIVDTEYSDPEKYPETTILYYAIPLKGSDNADAGETSDPFLNSFTIDAKVKTFIYQTETVDKEIEEIINGESHIVKYTTVTNYYTYDGCTIGLKVKVDAVQTHSAAEAIKSSWGRSVTIDGSGRITSLD